MQQDATSTESSLTTAVDVGRRIPECHTEEDVDPLADVVGLITKKRHDAASARMEQLKSEIDALRDQMGALAILQHQDALSSDGGALDAEWTDEDARWARERRALLEPPQDETSPEPRSGPVVVASPSDYSDDDVASEWGPPAEDPEHHHAPPLPSIVADPSSTLWWRHIENRLSVAMSARGGTPEAVHALSTLAQDPRRAVCCPPVPHDAFLEARMALWRSGCFA